MTIFRNIENWTGDNTGLAERVHHKDAEGNIISSYEELTDKPLINGIILQGDLSLDELNIQSKGDYVSQEDIPSKISELENDKGYLTNIPEEYVTEDKLDEKGYLTEHQDLSGYAKNTDIPTKVSQLTNDKNYITSIPEEYITENELNAKGFITSFTESDPTVPSHVKSIKASDINNWNAKSEFSGDYNDLSNKPTIPSISGLATEQYVDSAIASIPAVDLSSYATLDDVDDAITEIVGAAPETLDTLAELAEGLVANRDVVEVLNDSIEKKLDKDLKLDIVTMTGSHQDYEWYSANAIDVICNDYDSDLDDMRQDIPTKVSELSNDADYATKSYVDNAVSIIPMTDTWYYTASERENATIGSLIYDCPNASTAAYGFAIANPTGLNLIQNKPINLIRWRLSPDETKTSGSMTFGIYPIGSQTASKLITVNFTADNIVDGWVTNLLSEPVTIQTGETLVIQPLGNTSDVGIAVLRSSSATTTDEYINIYCKVPTEWQNSGNYITRLGICVDLGYRGVDTSKIDLGFNLEDIKSLNGLYYGYDFTDNTNGTPNFDTTTLQGAWNNSNLSELGYAATVGFDNQVYIKKYYVSDDIMTSAKIHLTAQDAQMAFGSLVRTDGAGGFSVGSLVKFDFTKKLLYICNKTDGTTNTTSYINISFADILSDSDLDFVLTVGRIKSRVFASISNYKTGKTVSLKSDDISVSDFSPVGRFYDYLTFMQNSGSTAYWQNLYTYVPTNVKIAFMGDSITQGIYLPSVDNSWVNILREYYGNCVSSGRGGAKIDFIIDALNDGLIKAYNPQYVVVTVGTNEGNTVEKLQTVVSKIKEIGATPIINCVSQTQSGKTTDGNEVIADVNKDILSLHQLGARFDIATGTNNNPEAVAAAGVLQDGVHPNSNGHALMAERFKFDLKGLK